MAYNSNWRSKHPNWDDYDKPSTALADDEIISAGGKLIKLNPVQYGERVPNKATNDM